MNAPASNDYDTLIALRPEGAPGEIKAWTRGVPFDSAAQDQLKRIASLPVIYRHVAAMPDVHLGKGATVGSVIATQKAIIPAAVGVDIGCGMMALQTSLRAKDLPQNLSGLRSSIEAAVPHGRAGWEQTDIPSRSLSVWRGELEDDFKQITDRHPQIAKTNHVNHLGSLGGGNHFIEVCLDEADRVWCMLHSGSRGVGNAIGRLFIELAKADMRNVEANLPDQDLAYVTEGTQHFAEYVQAVDWAQRFAAHNRELMMERVVQALQETKGVPPFQARVQAVNCHHNYVEREIHFGEEVYVTRKGAVRAGQGELGIIPGSMGARSFIVRGRGNPESYHSCSHGAGRAMSRNQAKREISVQDHAKSLENVECRRDESTLDETPKAYKDIDKVMAAQSSLVEIVHTLRQVLCVKG